ncbi:hypothetical protein MYX77_10315, partial [Acidobacteriia bacterium AH_259_A11_L15]|nr:hypothetical protein [Acidobacteriia bacterium AH_259_A11_L15]
TELETLELGDYVLVTGEIGNVGGGYSGLNRVEPRTLHLAQSVTSPRVHHLCKNQGGETVLSPRQAEQFVSFIKQNCPPWWWENASASVRDMLTAGKETPGDKARILFREAVSKWDGSSAQDETLPLIERALGLDLGLREARIMLGKMALARGDVNAAITNFQEELTKASRPDVLNAHTYLSAIYRELGQESDAQRHAQAGMETPEYKQNPTKLSPEAYERVRTVVSKYRRS